ncbi:hypothetical protein K458DRAFT_392671 [Lentithecium fluviatile CBS 122367]|uniref:Uncharacterized protein n=1 Tax=Lentithecium fluviatile CBS 122367 TaxID=1168545 RepID=A0A6G1IQW8_9PLEO|nr:hypothetical protein K458DRAFT_392671 [Lentithecium fluviatile CBS 122367]
MATHFFINHPSHLRLIKDLLPQMPGPVILPYREAIALLSQPETLPGEFLPPPEVLRFRIIYARIIDADTVFVMVATDHGYYGKATKWTCGPSLCSDVNTIATWVMKPGQYSGLLNMQREASQYLKQRRSIPTKYYGEDCEDDMLKVVRTFDKWHYNSITQDKMCPTYLESFLSTMRKHHSNLLKPFGLPVTTTMCESIIDTTPRANCCVI